MLCHHPTRRLPSTTISRWPASDVTLRLLKCTISDVDGRTRVGVYDKAVHRDVARDQRVVAARALKRQSELVGLAHYRLTG
jgi:hypothetical protein